MRFHILKGQRLKCQGQITGKVTNTKNRCYFVCVSEINKIQRGITARRGRRILSV